MEWVYQFAFISYSVDVIALSSQLLLEGTTGGVGMYTYPTQDALPRMCKHAVECEVKDGPALYTSMQRRRTSQSDCMHAGGLTHGAHLHG